MDGMKILKESGQFEDFKLGKIMASLRHSGISAQQADDVLKYVLSTLSPPLSTKKIRRAVKKLLRSMDMRSTMRYDLKQAIFALGPSGYPFEKYIGRILAAEGYEVHVGRIVDGHCVSHEVDIVARNGDTCYMVECKFHHNAKTQSTVQTALYTHARFMDIERAGKLCREGDSIAHRGMLVTNTKFSSEAIKYAECVGLKAIGWRYPDGDSLEHMIDRTHAYPVSVLPSITRSVLDDLLARDVVLASEVGQFTTRELARITGLSDAAASRLREQARPLGGQQV